ncbi:MAG: prepilin-type N-terminal cleavage/methylation domain-containing protein [Burkholderiaceae bacterium]|nr:prepilin-type N-terminal cleavage/methylation domain-containing protein [Burkholderiaceae bacterium]
MPLPGRLRTTDRRRSWPPRVRAPGASAGKGFTLVELLVAIAIMALVAVISWRGLSSLIATRDRLGPEADDVRALLAATGQMQLDLEHAVNPVLAWRPYAPVSVVTIDGAIALQILRFSEPLPDGASAVQQVTYAVVDGVLLRQCSAAVRSLPSASNVPVSTARLVRGVDSIQVRIWRANQGWTEALSYDPTMPPGIEVVLKRQDGTSLRRVLLVG